MLYPLSYWGSGARLPQRRAGVEIGLLKLGWITLAVERGRDPRKRLIQQRRAQFGGGEGERGAVVRQKLQRVAIGAPRELQGFLDWTAGASIDAIIRHRGGELDNNAGALEGVEAFLEGAGGAS